METNINLWQHIRKHMENYPNKTICEDKKLISYINAIKMAEEFGEKIADEQCCAILCDSQLLGAIALLACFSKGVTAVPLSIKYGEVHCAKIIDTIGPSAIITDADGTLQVTHLTASNYQKPEKHPALIMCTSGTTGTPKGAMLSEENILTNLEDICEYLNTNSEDRILISRPLYHCAVLTSELLTSLVKGLEIHFYSKQFNPKILYDLIREYKITVFCATPTLMSLMSRFNRNNSYSSLKTICISGEFMSQETADQIATSFAHAEIYNMYGLTEACPRVSYLPPNLFPKFAEYVGVPLKSVSLKIIKEDGTLASCGEDGILWVKGNNVMLGYYNAPVQTEKVLKDGWLCTGDIAVIDDTGLLKIKGRNDDLIIRAGMNIYPQEIESAIKKDHRVKQVLAYRIDNKIAGTQIGLKISGDFSDISEVKTLCISMLPPFQIPSVIEIVEELPKNGSGKIIRRVNYA